jgi:uroporphyrinogen III methyltransferase/synthase
MTIVPPTPATASQLVSLDAHGASVPVIAIDEPTDGGVALVRAAAEAHTYDWVVFTSSNAVERFVSHLRDARSFGGAQIAVVGSGTAETLARFHLVADLVPERFVAEALVDAFPAGTGRVLLPQAADARPVLADGLRAKGWTVEVVEAYRTVAGRPTAAALSAAPQADAIAFTSASTVRNYLDVAGPDAVPAVVVSIGPVTTRAAKEAGLEVTTEADPSTVDGLVDAVVETLRS